MTIKMNSKKNERENLSPTRRLIESEVPKNYHKFSFIFFLLSLALYLLTFFFRDYKIYTMMFLFCLSSLSSFSPRLLDFIYFISTKYPIWHTSRSLLLYRYICTINVRHHQKLNNAVCIIFLLSRNVFMLLNAIYHKSLGAAAVAEKII